jgi:hypothetical protein
VQCHVPLPPRCKTCSLASPLFVLLSRQVWSALFCDRLPLSTAQIGLISTLKTLGLSKLLTQRDLPAIRKWFQTANANGATDGYVSHVLKLAGVQYAVVRCDPFDPTETKHWRTGQPTHVACKLALAVNPVLAGDWPGIKRSVGLAGFSASADGLRKFLDEWCDRVAPEFLAAAVPAEFTYGTAEPAETAATEKGGVPTAAGLVEQVLLPLCKARELPLALTFGQRSINPSLDSCGGGGGVRSAGPNGLEVLVGLCLRNPKIKFLAACVAEKDQHEFAAAAQKLRNLHLLGCRPSLVRRVTPLRLALLHTGFTAGASCATVLEDIIAKVRSQTRSYPPVFLVVSEGIRRFCM